MTTGTIPGVRDALRPLRRAAAGAGLLAGGLLLSTVGLAYFVARVLTDPRRPGPQDDYVMTPFETGAQHEEVVFPAATGDHQIHGWWFPRPSTTRVIIGCTGYRGSKAELIGISTALWRAGFNVLLFDYHGHGAGRGVPVTLGYRELHDFYSALDYALRRVPGARIGVIGYSMGASIAIMGSARRPEVRAVVADSPFATHAEVVSHNVARVIHVSGRPVAALADVFLAWLAGYRSRDVEPVRDVRALAPRPLLLIHGTADQMIPLAHSQRVFAAAGEPKELWLGEGADHCGTYFLDRSAYCERVIGFFERALDADLPEAADPASARPLSGIEAREPRAGNR
jgi:fermentation-respiration switch protein FrsA (DUF1100 family)